MTTTFAAERSKGTFDSVDVQKCRFNMGTVKFMDSDQVQEDSLKHPISILARTDQPIDHWYWGRIVHDISGIKLHKESIVIDYCHSDYEIMGYLDKFDREGGLQCSGALVKIPGSQAEKVCINAANDVPYEASIFFDPDHGIVIEEVGQGASSEVNGFTIEGPAVIVRECLLRAVAICPHGADMNASTQFSSKNQSVSVRFASKGSNMSDEPKPGDKPTTQAVEFNKDGFGQLVTKVDDALSKFGAIEEMLTKLSKSDEGDEEPKDLPTALAKIKDLETKLSKQSEAAADTTTDGGAGSESGGAGQFNFQEEIEKVEKRLEAKFKHSANSDSDPISGDGGESGKKKDFASLFSYRGSKNQEAEA